MKSLSDVVSGAGLHLYAEVALIIFLAVFLAIVVRVLFARRSRYEHEANLPLEDDAPPPPSNEPPEPGR